jgi:hypothetical protein
MLRFRRLRPFVSAPANLTGIRWTAGGSRVSVPIARRPNPVAFSAASRLTAYFASAKGFFFGGFDAFLYDIRPVIDIEPQSAELLFHLQHLECASSCAQNL